MDCTNDRISNIMSSERHELLHNKCNLLQGRRREEEGRKRRRRRRGVEWGRGGGEWEDEEAGGK